MGKEQHCVSRSFVPGGSGWKKEEPPTLALSGAESELRRLPGGIFLSSNERRAKCRGVSVVGSHW